MNNEKSNEYTRLKAQLSTLKEVAKTYRGRTIDNIIQNYEARIEYMEHHALNRYNYDMPVGEVFEYEGSIYQCKEAGEDCAGCAFNGTDCYTKLVCSREYRADKKNVIFIREKAK